MSYVNPIHRGRLVLMPRVRNVFAELHFSTVPRGGVETELACCPETIRMYQVNELGAHGVSGDLFNFPYLFHKDGRPWIEANSYLLSLIKNKVFSNRPSDDIRRRASKLLDYLIFCEERELDWLDFSGKRPVLRPTYKYFSHLLSSARRSKAVVNQYTGVVYNFYKFVSSSWHSIDMDRVDTTKQTAFLVSGVHGTKLVSAVKRSQTKPIAPKSSVPIGFVREDGEDLRPLANVELASLLNILKDKKWSPMERLLMLTSLMTGARKQTVLTIRIKHLKNFTEENLQADGTYLLHAGPGTGIDTKNNTKQRLYFPKQLADELRVLSASNLMVKRRVKFNEQMERHFPESHMREEDLYLFLSDQGGCYYMAKDDPRYPVVKSRPAGQVVDTVKRKLMCVAGVELPNDFSYHWLRATYAFQLYQLLQPLLATGQILPGEEITFIQHRMHHKRRETTESYLKLFKMHSQKLMAQEMYEEQLFKFQGYDDLKLGLFE